MDASETSTLPTAQPWLSPILKPETPGTYPLPEEAGNNEARIQSLHAPTETAVHRLPMEIWIAVCDALRRLDLTDITIPSKSRTKGYPELQRLPVATANKNRPDPIINVVSILPLSHTCRYLHKVTSPSLLETIRIAPPSVGGGKLRYRSLMQQIKSLQLNNNQRLQHVKGFAVLSSHVLKEVHGRDYESELRNKISHLLMRFPNLHHLTVIGMELDGPFMHNILTLPLEHLWLWNVEPDNPDTFHTFAPATTPKINLRSLVLEDSWSDYPSVPVDWISQLIGPSMQDLSIEANDLVYGLLSKTPNLKEVAIEVDAALDDPADAIPALPHLERAVCRASWLPVLLPGRPIATVKVLCTPQVRVQELFEVLHKGSVSLRDLTLTYTNEWPRPTWSPDDLEPLSRSLPELEILRLRIRDPKMAGLQKAFLHISQLQKLRIISFTASDQPSRVDSSGTIDEVWQESKLKEFLGSTKSPVLERVGFGEEHEWKLEDTGVWMLWRGGKMVRSVSL
ncbi:hypothetical protein FS837_004916 [Tulasnella sp. UAMH 9824]|nr:hypothetical protein FS837_004916 [Tulasnella sp. UAMH 9824]